jgi:hypothetical protein
LSHLPDLLPITGLRRGAGFNEINNSALLARPKTRLYLLNVTKPRLRLLAFPVRARGGESRVRPDGLCRVCARVLRCTGGSERSSPGWWRCGRGGRLRACLHRLYRRVGAVVTSELSRGAATEAHVKAPASKWAEPRDRYADRHGSLARAWDRRTAAAKCL